METIRLIHYSNESGSKEGVYFTTNLHMDAQGLADILPPGCTVVSDQEIEMFDNGFPMEYNLEKTF